MTAVSILLLLLLGSWAYSEAADPADELSFEEDSGPYIFAVVAGALAVAAFAYLQRSHRRRRKRASATVSDFTFRLRFLLPPTEAIGVKDCSFVLTGGARPTMLVTHDGKTAIADARDLVLKSSGWASADAALQAAADCENALQVTLARLGQGADFGKRGPQSRFYKAGLKMLAEELATERPVLQDKRGAMVFESTPPPVFASLGPVQGVRIVQPERFAKVFDVASRNPPRLSDRERISFILYSSSFFAQSADTRFLTLMMAVEALLEPRPRSSESCAVVDSLLKVARDAGLPEDERESLLGSLRWFYKEAINQAGRRLAAERLGGREYNGMSAPTFFSRCYNLRSRLVHGSAPFPVLDEVNSLVATLGVFVSNLLASSLLDVEA